MLPVTSLQLEHAASEERISTGVPERERMFGGRGFHRGSSVLIHGTSGTGKTSLAASIADATCRRGERCLFLAFEESEGQVVRNIRSIGIDLAPWIEQDLLRLQASRPTTYGLETHLVMIHRMVDEFRPHVVIVDPVTSFLSAGTIGQAEVMIARLIDRLKNRQITAIFTSLSHDQSLEQVEVHVSSIIDTWIVLRDIELHGERKRSLYIRKSRGTAHSNQIRDVLITDRGIELPDFNAGAEGAFTSSRGAPREDGERAAAEVLAPGPERSDISGRRHGTGSE